MKNKIVLISKDVLRQKDLQPYGNTYWETPNICDLASKGTIFFKHYTSAPSTSMSFTSMFTGLYAYQLNRKNYTEVEEFTIKPTLFDELERLGYCCHIIWSHNYMKMAYNYTKCYGKSTRIHNLDINVPVGKHKFSDENPKKNDALSKNTINKILTEIDGIINDDKVFLWIHLPHVLKGRTGYGSDIDLLDYLIGEIRKRFEDDGIYLTADHGHMNLTKGKIAYGYDLYEEAIRIPLITPKLCGMNQVNFPTSNIQLMDIILNGSVDKHDYVISDTAYYAQPHRKIAIIMDNFKYIYNKKKGLEELYDLDWDIDENINLISDTILDIDRNLSYNLKEYFFYPYYEIIESKKLMFQDIFNKVWEKGTPLEEFVFGLHKDLSHMKRKYFRK